MTSIFKISPRRATRGTTLLEVLLGVTVAAMIASFSMYSVNESAKTLRAKNAGDQLNLVVDAATSYIHNNYAAIEAAVASNGGKLATDLEPLRTLGYLPSGSFNENPYGSSYQIWMHQTGTAPNTAIEAMLVTVGGYDPGETKAPQAAFLAGGKAGFVKPSDPNTVLGIHGGWTAKLDDFRGPGASAEPVRLASIIHFNKDQVLEDYLYRVVVDGHPEANTMNTDINMGGDTGTAFAIKHAGGFRIDTEKPSTLSSDLAGALIFGKEEQNDSFHIYKHADGTPCGTAGDCLVFDGNSGDSKFIFGNGEGSFSPTALIDATKHQVAINTNAPSSEENLYVDGTGRITQSLAVGAGDLTGNERLYVQDDARVTGNLNVGDGSSSGDKLWVGGTARVEGTVHATDSITSDHDIEAANGSMRARAFYYVSDGRLKTDISTIKGSLERLLRVHGFKYRWKADGTPDYGLIAQDVANEFPELVHANENGELAVKYANMVGPIIEALRELHDENADLRTRMDTIPVANAWNKPQLITRNETAKE